MSRLHRNYSVCYGQAQGFVLEARDYSRLRWRLDRISEFVFGNAAGGGGMGRVPGMDYVAHRAINATGTWADATSVLALGLPLTIEQARVLNRLHVASWMDGLTRDGTLYRDEEDGDVYDSHGRLLSTVCGPCGVRVAAWLQCARDALEAHKPNCGSKGTETS